MLPPICKIGLNPVTGGGWVGETKGKTGFLLLNLSVGGGSDI